MNAEFTSSTHWKNNFRAYFCIAKPKRLLKKPVKTMFKALKRYYMTLSLKIHWSAAKYAAKGNWSNQGTLLDCSNTKLEAVLIFVDLSFWKTTCKKDFSCVLETKETPKPRGNVNVESKHDCPSMFINSSRKFQRSRKHDPRVTSLFLIWHDKTALGLFLCLSFLLTLLINLSFKL